MLKKCLKRFGVIGKIIFLLLFMIGCNKNQPNDILCQDGKRLVNIVSKQNSYSFCVEIADTAEKQNLGLMYRDFLGKDEGMLFIFGDEEIQSFWMKNTKIPLDMIFFDQNRNLVDYKKDASPCTSDICPSYISKGKAKYVLEINSGLVKMDDYKLQISE